MRISPDVVLDVDHLRREVDYLLKQDAFAYDCETSGITRLQPVRSKVTWLSFATYGRAFVLPLGHPIGDKIVGETKIPKMDAKGKVRHYKQPIWEDPPQQLRWVDVRDTLRPLFFNRKIIKVGHNLPFDLMSVAKYFDGRPPTPPYEDTQVVQWLLNENILKGLKDLTRRFFKFDYDRENVGKCVESHPFSKVARYAFLDARMTWLHYQRTRGLTEREGLGVIHDLERAIIEVVTDMGLTGAPVNVAHIEELERRYEKRLVELEAAIYRAAGRQFNINSSQQKAQVLFGPKKDGGQGLKPLQHTDKGAPSTEKSALEPYADNPVVASLFDHSQVYKLQNTYVRPWLGHHDKKDKPAQIIDGRIHAAFKQSGTDTGRFSSSDPNMQNIPSRTEEGRLLRAGIAASEGYKLLVADYDQIELRILAHFAADGRLYDAFMQGLDPHTATAATVFGIPLDKVTSVQRSAGKGSGFAVIYGSSAETVSAQYGVPLRMARQFLKEHPSYFPEIYDLKARILEVCRSRRPPHVKTLLGRRRRLPEIWAREKGIRLRAERQAVNAVIQGSNADITKKAMTLLHPLARRELPEFKLILTVHDELVGLCPEDRVEEGVDIMQRAMLGPEISSLLRVPVTAEVKVVDRWSEAKS